MAKKHYLGSVVDSDNVKKTLSDAWWLTEGKSDKDPTGKALANHITDVATRLETSLWNDRYRTVTFYRHYFGRPTASFAAYGLAKRPSSFVNYFSQFEFASPTFNIIRACGDVYENRCASSRTHTQVIPERGHFNQRQAAKGLTEWIGAEFEHLDFWKRFNEMFIDSLYAGSGIVKVAPDHLGKQPAITLVGRDELLLNNPDDTNPQSVIQRLFANREDLIDVYGDDEAALKAILEAPSAYPAFYFGTMECTDIVPVLAAYKTNRLSGKKGRYVLVIGDLALKDETYDDDKIPFIKFDFHTVAGSFFGQGLAEILITTNSEINRLLAAIKECMERLAWPRWLVEENSSINEASLGDLPATISKYMGIKPELITPNSVNAELINHVERLIRFGMDQAHISAQALKGEVPHGMSGVALDKYVAIDDANLKGITLRLNDFVKEVAIRLIKLGIQLKPPTNLPGYSEPLVNWTVVKEAFNDRPISIQVFSENQLSQEPAGRQHELDTLRDNQDISQATYKMFSQIPDLDAAWDIENAPMMSVEKMLDNITMTGEWSAPTPFMDLNYAKDQVEKRHALESSLNVPKDRLDLLLQWRAAVIDLQHQKTTPDAPPAPPEAPPGPMGTAPEGVPPGASPEPFSPVEPPPGPPQPQLPLAPPNTISGQ
jgi:hypothetical protein